MNMGTPFPRACATWLLSIVPCGTRKERSPSSYPINALHRSQAPRAGPARHRRRSLSRLRSSAANAASRKPAWSSEKLTAPTGRRPVATGGAPPAARRAVRNPWERSCFNTSAPLGAAECAGRAADQCPFGSSGVSFAPMGEKRRKGSWALFPHPLSTGCASGRCAAAPLHPWQQSVAPLGRNTAPPCPPHRYKNGELSAATERQ